MKYNQELIDHLFTYHAPTEEQRANYLMIREAARNFAAVIILNTPESPDQTTAIRKLRECVMTANAAIALGGKS
jgi:hypothetical protein